MPGPQGSQVVEASGPFEQDGIIGDNSATLSCSDCLVQLKAVDSDVSDRPQRAAFVAGSDTLSTVLQDLELMLVGDAHDAVHIAGIPLKMNHHDHLGLWSDLAFNIHWVDVERFINLSEYGQRAGQHNRIETGVPSPSRQNDFVARANLQCR